MTLAAAGALSAGLVMGAARWPTVASVGLYDYEGTRGKQQWLVMFATGAARPRLGHALDAITVVRENDTATTEQVLGSRQVRAALGQRRRSHIIRVVAESSAVFLGLLLVFRLPWLRRRLARVG